MAVRLIFIPLCCPRIHSSSQPLASYQTEMVRYCVLPPLSHEVLVAFNSQQTLEHASDLNVALTCWVCMCRCVVCVCVFSLSGIFQDLQATVFVCFMCSHCVLAAFHGVIFIAAISSPPSPHLASCSKCCLCVCSLFSHWLLPFKYHLQCRFSALDICPSHAHYIR